jgi:light-regulated signal transduction histidine kinase (bacteriophytochrome)
MKFPDTGADFQALLEAAADAAVVVDARGKIVLANAKTENMFGYPRSELLGKPLELLIPERFCNLHALRRDGARFPVEISSSPLRIEDGLLVYSAIRDVTDEKNTELALRIANLELEAISDSVAHDLRAPLRGMSGFAQILLEDYQDKLDADGVDCLHEIRDNAARMGALIDALLSLSQVSRSEMKPRRIDLSLLAGAALERLKASEPERKVEALVPRQLWAFLDPPLARTLLEILIGNAWKFTGKTPLARIEVGTADVEGVPAFFVSDNGAGFDPAHEKKLFLPFQRLHTSAEFRGTGVGLATARRIVHRHRGRIWARGAVGEGAAFYFSLPADGPPAGGRSGA